MSYKDVLEFWFGKLEDGFADDAHRKRWYKSSKALDDDIRERFAPTIDEAASGALDDWLATPEGRLAFIVLCDQFPRNAFRGTARAFEFDPLALDAAREGITLGQDRELETDERGFFYMPFEHSEDLIDQHTSVGLFAQLQEDTPDAHKERVSIGYARQHRDLIVRFGRFPHRNKVLGRESTVEEEAYLTDGRTFGQ